MSRRRRERTGSSFSGITRRPDIGNSFPGGAKRRWTFERLEERTSPSDTLGLLLAAAWLDRNEGPLPDAATFADELQNARRRWSAAGDYSSFAALPAWLEPWTNDEEASNEVDNASIILQASALESYQFDDLRAELGDTWTLLRSLWDVDLAAQPSEDGLPADDGLAEGAGTVEDSPVGPSSAGAETLELDSAPAVTEGDVASGLLADGIMVEDSDGGWSMLMGPPMNQPPVAQNDSYGMLHDRTLNAPAPGVLLNDFDPNGDPMTASLVSGPTHASFFSLSANGSFSYTPAAFWIGVDSFSYRAFDGQMFSNVATATITVANTPPGAQNDLYGVRAGTTLTVPPAGVLINDGDTDGDAITAVKQTDPANGTVVLNANGSLVYTPAAGFSGTDSFTYKAFDGIAYSQLATVSIEVIFVELQIGDGQGGAYLSELMEDTRGAYTVANLNDTDGDGRTDVGDLIVIPATTTSTDPIVPEGSTIVHVNSAQGFSEGDWVYIYDVTQGGRPQRNKIAPAPGGIAGLQFTFESSMIRNFVTPTIQHGGRADVDLMPLLISVPSPFDPLFPEARLTVSGNVQLWTQPWKETSVPLTNGQVSFNLQFMIAPVQLWVEATNVSQALRDITLTLEYKGITDSVKATGIWTTVTNVAHDLRNVGSKSGPPSDLFADPIYSDIEEPPMDAIVEEVVVGLRPTNPPLVPDMGIAEMIVIQFTVWPARNITVDGRWEADGVHFDATRQIAVTNWIQQVPSGPWIPDANNPTEYFPVSVELPNDDLGEIDESNQVADQNHVYSMDAPKWPTTEASSPGGATRFNAFEFLRVAFGSNPAGEVVAGSQVSTKYEWHNADTLAATIVGNQSVWVRTTGDDPEIEGINSIGPNHISLDPPY